MFKIIEINFEQGFQRDLCHEAYLDRAKDRCQIIALNYVIEKEGIAFLNRKCNNKIKKGYNLKFKNTPYYMKITVLRKEVDGYFSSGALVKVTQFITIKVNRPAPEPRESLFEKNIYYDEVLLQLKETRPEYNETIYLNQNYVDHLGALVLEPIA